MAELDEEPGHTIGQPPGTLKDEEDDELGQNTGHPPPPPTLELELDEEAGGQKMGHPPGTLNDEEEDDEPGNGKQKTGQPLEEELEDGGTGRPPPFPFWMTLATFCANDATSQFTCVKASASTSASWMFDPPLPF